MVFKGQYDHEVMSEYKEWYCWVKDVFMPLVDTESGDFRHLPYPGGMMEQPYCTMQVLSLIQINYRNVIREQNQKEMRAYGNR